MRSNCIGVNLSTNEGFVHGCLKMYFFSFER